MLFNKKATNSRDAFHANWGPSSNVLCLNGSAHRKSTGHRRHVTCPACLMMIKTGCSATEAIEAWK